MRIKCRCGAAMIAMVCGDGSRSWACEMMTAANFYAHDCFPAPYRDAIDDVIKEGERFLEKLKGRKDERADGAYVVLTRLMRSFKSMRVKYD